MSATRRADAWSAESDYGCDCLTIEALPELEQATTCAKATTGLTKRQDDQPAGNRRKPPGSLERIGFGSDQLHDTGAK